MTMVALAIAFVGLALGVPVAVLAGAAGQARVAAAAVEGISRQPEAGSEIRVLMIISLAFIESLVLYALLTFFLLWPNIGKMLDKVQGG